MSNLSTMHQNRFSNAGISKRKDIWKTLSEVFFLKLVPPDVAILDLACGYGEFINNISAGRKFAVDLNPDSPKHLAPDAAFHSPPGRVVSRKSG